MSISSLGTVGTSVDSTLESSRTSIDTDDFLNIFLAELNNQDPTEPLSTSDYINQLCSLSELSQFETLNEGIADLLTYQSASIDESALSFVGKYVTVEDNTLNVTEGESTDISFRLDDEAATVYLYIYDDSGELVAEMEESQEFSSGNNTLTWDGTDYNGNTVEEGQYFYSIFAVDESGNMVSATQLYSGKVNSVRFGDGQAVLVTDDREIELNEVIEAQDASEIL